MGLETLYGTVVFENVFWVLGSEHRIKGGERTLPGGHLQREQRRQERELKLEFVANAETIAANIQETGSN